MAYKAKNRPIMNSPAGSGYQKLSDGSDFDCALIRSARFGYIAFRPEADITAVQTALNSSKLKWTFSNTSLGPVPKREAHPGFSVPP